MGVVVLRSALRMSLRELLSFGKYLVKSPLGVIRIILNDIC
jgi:hypothetical protein